jgi:hypothetical protein
VTNQGMVYVRLTVATEGQLLAAELLARLLEPVLKRNQITDADWPDGVDVDAEGRFLIDGTVVDMSDVLGGALRLLDRAARALADARGQDPEAVVAEVRRLAEADASLALAVGFDAPGNSDLD